MGWEFTDRPGHEGWVVALARAEAAAAGARR
jgi:hypothetical protein